MGNTRLDAMEMIAIWTRERSEMRTERDQCDDPQLRRKLTQRMSAIGQSIRYYQHRDAV